MFPWWFRSLQKKRLVGNRNQNMETGSMEGVRAAYFMAFEA
jgi:hypothetical protein